MKMRQVCCRLGLVVASATAGCKNLQAPTTTVKGAGADGTSRKFLLTVQSKGFIAPIPSRLIGSLSKSFFGRAVLLREFAAATNLNFSESPPDGMQRSAQYRLWAEINLQGACAGDQIVMKDARVKTDAGYEGPFKAGFKPLAVHLRRDGAFSYLAQGWPNPAAEPAFAAVHARVSPVIWYTVKGRVICAAGEADVVVADGDAVTTPFPSFRLWASKVALDGGAGYTQKLVIDRPQAEFSQLWILPAPPADAPALSSSSNGLALDDTAVAPANADGSTSSGTASGSAVGTGGVAEEVPVTDGSVGADLAGPPAEPDPAAVEALGANPAEFCQVINAGAAASACIRDANSLPPDAEDAQAPVQF